MIMDRLYGGVCYAGIDTDPELKYPKVKKQKIYGFERLKRHRVMLKFYYSCASCVCLSLSLFYSIFAFRTKKFRALVVWHFRVSRAILLPFPLASFNCNTMTLINALRWSHTFSTIKCVMNVKDNDAVENLLHSFVLMSLVCRYVLAKFLSETFVACLDIEKLTSHPYSFTHSTTASTAGPQFILAPAVNTTSHWWKREPIDHVQFHFVGVRQRRKQH